MVAASKVPLVVDTTDGTQGRPVGTEVRLGNAEVEMESCFVSWEFVHLHQKVLGETVPENFEHSEVDLPWLAVSFLAWVQTATTTMDPTGSPGVVLAAFCPTSNFEEASVARVS